MTNLAWRECRCLRGTTKGTKGLEKLPLEQPFDRSQTGDEGKKKMKKKIEIF